MAARKLAAEIEAEIVRRYAAGGVSQASLALEYGIAQPTICRIVSGREADAAYYRANEDAFKDRANARFHAMTPAEKLERGRRARANEPEGLRARRAREEQARVKADVLNGYGGACACCGTTYEPHLTLDHIEGGGSQHRKVEDARSLYRRLRREGFPPGYQVLCWNCNWAKHVEGECACQGARLRLVEGGDA